MIRVRTLGPVSVAVDGGAPPPELLWKKNLALLVYLARSPHRARSRDHLVALLWGDRPETAARHSLREAIRVLRRALGEGGVDAAGDQVQLRAGAVQLDSDELAACAARGDWAAAARLATGEFLEGLVVGDAPAFEDWMAAERVALRGPVVEALVRHAEARLAAGDQTAAAAAAARAQAVGPGSDAAARALMRALALAGDRTGALAAFDQLRARLDELGAVPEAATMALVAQVRRERSFAAALAPARGAESRRAPLTGRADTLAATLAIWHACHAGRRAAAVVLDADPGLGRSRLLEEVTARARLDGAAAATVRAVPADADEAWSGAIGLARGGLIEAPGLLAAPAGALAFFAARHEDWADRFPASRGAAVFDPRAALTAVARAVAQEQPLVLALDDAQWLDRDSLRTLAALTRDLADLPLLLVVAATPHPAREELDQLRAGLGRDVPGAVCRLGPLTGDDLTALTRWAMPHYDDAQVSRLARRLAADSAGLPLLAVEILHAVALGLDVGADGVKAPWPAPERTLDQTLPGDLPETITAALRIGFNRLGQDTRAVLLAAAVAGDRAGTELLARATGFDPGRLAAALDDAEWRRWLAADGRGYTFLARTVRDVIARDMVTAGQRRRLREVAGLPPDA